jgi:hypothetical protein
MKRASILLSLACAAVLALSGCAQLHRLNENAAPPPAGTVMTAAPTPAAAPAIETIPFRTGVSSATVEKMARQRGCLGGQGAGLITEPGPVEVYRMRCEDGAMRGKVFMARCELRQCRAM